MEKVKKIFLVTLFILKRNLNRWGRSRGVGGGGVVSACYQKHRKQYLHIHTYTHIYVYIYMLFLFRSCLVLCGVLSPRESPHWVLPGVPWPRWGGDGQRMDKVPLEGHLEGPVEMDGLYVYVHTYIDIHAHTDMFTWAVCMYIYI